jgi:hypothetical protein
MQADSNSSIKKHNGGIPPGVLNLITKWIKVVSFTPKHPPDKRIVKIRRGLENVPQSLHCVIPTMAKKRRRQTSEY